MALREYLTTEVGEDWVDGLITRREAVRRLVLLGHDGVLRVGPAGGLRGADLAQSGDAASRRRVVGDRRRVGIGGGIRSPAAATPGEAITFPGPTGELQGFLATGRHARRGDARHPREPRAHRPHPVGGGSPGRRRLHVARHRPAVRGGRYRGARRRRQVPAALAAASTERLVGDMAAGLTELERRVPGAKLGIIGFCFGGGMVWTLLDAGEPRLAAAIPFYGPAPAAPDFSGNTAAVLGVYAELDGRVNASSTPRPRRSRPPD